MNLKTEFEQWQRIRKELIVGIADEYGMTQEEVSRELDFEVGMLSTFFIALHKKALEYKREELDIDKAIQRLKKEAGI